MSSIPHDALVLVGDGARAVFLRNNGTPMNPDLAVERVFEHENPPTREQGTDRPTRGQIGMGNPRSAIEPTDWQQLNEDRFATEIADKLYKLAHANRFQRLFIVAPPKVLGTLRKSLHKEVIDRIHAEIPKELATSSVNTIQRELSNWVPPEK
jgi:protein required for attachment to host cells